MHRLLGLGLCALVACDSGTPVAHDKADKPGKRSKAEKAEQSAKEFDDMLVAPSADVIAALGADVYPGARMLKGFAAMRSEAGGRSTVDYIFFTPDPAPKVREFYAGKLAAAKPGDPMMEKMGAYVVKGTNANGDEVTVQARATGTKTDFHFIVTKKK